MDRVTMIRRLLLAGVVMGSMTVAGCALIISSDDHHRHDGCGDDCEDCHSAVVVMDWKKHAIDSCVVGGVAAVAPVIDSAASR